MKNIVYRPRNDRVILQVINLGQTESGVALPDSAIEGKEYIVHAVGPKVEDLNVGDKVLMTGQKNVDYAFLPNRTDLLIIDQANVVLTMEEDESLEPEDE